MIFQNTHHNGKGVRVLGVRGLGDRTSILQRLVVPALGGLVLLSVTIPQPARAAGAGQLALVQRASLPASPADKAWSDVAVVPVPLVVQDMVEPRLLDASTAEVRVRAATDGTRVAFLLDWDDATGNDEQKPSSFIDACAVQLPATVAADVPAPQMGEPGRGVEISYWRASWQAMVDGRPDTLKAIYPNAAIDHYPFEAESLEKDPAAKEEMAKRYAPARAVGNTMAGPRQQPVEDLIAEGPGSLSPAPKSQSTGSGKRGAKGWSVMIVRPLPQGLTPGKRTQVAFAVWQGAHGESGARKMRSVWMPLAREANK